jgi:TonB-dependent starch-binding outer membrane protein SusC
MKKILNLVCLLLKQHRKKLIVMRNTVLILLISALQVFATGSYAQTKTISLAMNDATIREVLYAIQKQSEFYFLYNSELIDVTKKVDITIEKEKVDAILTRLFDKNEVDFLIKDRYIVLTPVGGNAELFAEQQQRTVSGKVTDESGQPLPGVTVLVKGTTQGTVTNSDGEYSLTNIPEDATLVFSFVGMRTQEVEVGSQTNIDVTMEVDAIGIEEVVAIGYGTIKKANVTGAMSGVKDNELTGRATTTMQEALAGKMAGVIIQNVDGRPGQETTMTIRGITSLSAATGPLYVVDGITTTSITDLNMKDVESIEVIKDAASAAIYGARGGNGVVLITTKSGTRGTKISVDVNTGFQEPERVYNTMTGQEFYDYQNWYWDTYYEINGGDLSTPWEDRPADQRVPIYTHELDPNNIPNTDWNDLFYRKGLIQDYAITASGSGKNVRYYFSARYVDQDYIILNTNYNTLTFRAKIDVDLKEWLHTGINISPSYVNSYGFSNTGKGDLVSVLVGIPPYTLPHQNTWDEDNTRTFNLNPVISKKRILDETKRSNNDMRVYTQVDITNKLNFKTTFGYNSNLGNNQYFVPGSVNWAGLTSTWGSYSTNTVKMLAIENNITFDSKITEKDNLNVIIGTSGEKWYTLSSYQQKTGFPTAKIPTLNMGTQNSENETEIVENRLASYFARVRYEYADKYLLTITGRYDGSSRFGPENKWGFFPSVSAGWKISEENFLDDVSWLDMLKLRASYGIAGNNQIGDFRWLSTLSQSNYNLDGTIEPGYRESGAANPELTWEVMKTFNLGLDFNVLNNRVQVSTNYYINNNDRSILEIPLPTQSGFGSYLDNTGEIVSKGFEFELFSHNLDGEFGWTTSFNLATNSNEILSIPTAYNLNRFGVYARNEVGHSLNEWYLYQVDGLITEEDMADPTVAKKPDARPGSLKYIDVNGNGEIDGDDLDWSGRATPKFIYGLTNNFNYKNFDFSVLLQAISGGKRLEMGGRTLDYGGSGLVSQIAKWTNSYRSPDEPGDGETPLPDRFSDITNWNTWQLVRSDYLKIKSVTLGYNIPKSMLERLKIQSAKITLSGENLFTWLPEEVRTTINPEAANGADSKSTYVDYGTTPLSRKFKVGINVTF